MSKSTNTTPKKPTKRQMFESLLTLPDLTTEQVAFINHELELLTKKNSGEKKLTAVQVANIQLKVDIENAMEVDRMYTVSDMVKTFVCCDGLSSSKVTAMLTQMAEDGIVERTVIKGRAYYSKKKS